MAKTVLVCLCTCLISLVSAGRTDELTEELSAQANAAHYVAVNGNDAGPGTFDRPWATINHAAEEARPGDIVFVRGGQYSLSAQVRVVHSGRSGAWISFIGYPSETPVLDAQLLPRSSLVKEGLDNGAIQIERASYIRIINLTVINSRDIGFNIRDSSNVDLINNSTKGTFSSGIAVWDTNHAGERAQHIRILGNSVSRATTLDLAPFESPKDREPAHEAISIAGAVHFEVAYNHVFDSDKEGIDVKETSKWGQVHHNLVDNVARQCFYVDAWFGTISNVEVFSNVLHDCRMAGIVLSVENGMSVRNINIHNNLVFNNFGSGLYFSRWGADGERQNIQIQNNTFFHNGHAAAKDGQTYFWMTGGVYLYSTNIRDISIINNIFSENRGFQIGYSELFLKNSRSWQMASVDKGIQITGNLLNGPNETSIKSGGDPVDQVEIYAVNGSNALIGDPLFINAANENFGLRPDSPADGQGFVAGAYSGGSTNRSWWRENFPPQLLRLHLQ
jgi:hypothetical protein